MKNILHIIRLELTVTILYLLGIVLITLQVFSGSKLNFSISLNPLEEVDLLELQNPIVYLVNDKFETLQSGVWLNIRSNQAIYQPDTELIKEQSDSNSKLFSYSFYLRSFGIGENKLKLEFRNEKNIVSYEYLYVRRNKVENIGLWKVEEGRVIKDPDNLLAKVDKTYCVPYYWQPDDLVNISKYEISTLFGEEKVRKVVVDELRNMVIDMKEEGYLVSVVSAYRSFDHQLALYQSRVVRDGAQSAYTQVAPPGHSEHQLGTTVDLTSQSVLNGTYSSFEYTPSAKWIAENAHNYGFVISYPEGSERITGYRHEAWHIRYVGKKNAEEIRQSGLVPIEYIRNLR